MPDVLDESDRREFKRIRRRNMLRTACIAAPMLVAWWFLYHRIERVSGVDKDAAYYGTLWGLLLLAWAVLKLTGWDRVGDPRETPRLRWLRDEQLDRYRIKSRKWMFIMLLALLAWELIRFWMPASGSDARSDHWFIAGQLVTVLVLLFSSFPDRTRNELDHVQFLEALRWGFATMILVGGAAFLCDAYRPGTASSNLPLVLILSLLVTQIRLAILKRRKRLAAGD